MYLLYQEIFDGIDAVSLFNEPTQDYFSNHWLSAIVLESYEKRESLRLILEADNIESRPLWKPMHLQPIFEKYPYYGAHVAEGLFEKGLCLPSGSNLSVLDQERIKAAITTFFE
jgi:dTDP-4-amino-4,6-dideoxygalactose transaminase